jgi:hypothetical protein
MRLPRTSSRVPASGESFTMRSSKVAASVADVHLLAARDAASIERLKKALDEPEPIVVPQLDGDVQDIDGLLALYRHLSA